MIRSSSAAERGDKARALAGKLIQDIESGLRSPGDPLPELAIAKQNGVSQTTARQALQYLERDGLSERSPSGGMLVINPTQQDIQDRVEVRIPLEMLAAKLAASRMSDQEREKLGALARDIDDSGSADRGFHELVWSSSGNLLLAETLRRLCVPLLIFIAALRKAGLQRLGHRARSHRLVFDAICSNDALRIESVVDEHIRGAYELFRKKGPVDMRALKTFKGFQDEGPEVSMQRNYLRWIPALVLIRDSHSLLLYANKEFERFTRAPRAELIGKGPDLHLPMLAKQIKDIEREIRKSGDAVLSVENVWGSMRMTVRFPMMTQIGQDPEPAVGTISFDLRLLMEAEAAQTSHHKVAELDHPFAAYHTTSDQEVDRDLLTGFFDACPAVAAWKDRRGALLFASRSWETVMHRSRLDVLGKLPTENWPPRFGGDIMAYDKLVRDLELPHFTTDTYSILGKLISRINIRFPLFDRSRRLEGTASLGLDPAWLELAKTMEKGLRPNTMRHEKLPTSETPDSGSGLE